MFTDAEGLEHQVERYFILGDQHIVQCDCGERFRARTERRVMQDHFHHAWSSVEVPF